MATDVPNSPSTIMPAMRYRDASAAIEWLSKVFGLQKHAVYPGPNGTIGHAELALGGGMIMLGSEKDDTYGRGFKPPGDVGDVETRSVYIVVDDANVVYERAKAAGGRIVRELQETDYGSREFTVKDAEGHSWSVGTYNPWASHS
ncbi:MAG: VOC family protein [Acidobacteria bacterium]|nr:VOC family protein [Acidobacteriota bacterium]